MKKHLLLSITASLCFLATGTIASADSSIPLVMSIAGAYNGQICDTTSTCTTANGRTGDLNVNYGTFSQNGSSEGANFKVGVYGSNYSSGTTITATFSSSNYGNSAMRLKSGGDYVSYTLKDGSTTITNNSPVTLISTGEASAEKTISLNINYGTTEAKAGTYSDTVTVVFSAS